MRTASGGTPAGTMVDLSGVLPVATTTLRDNAVAGSAYTPVTGARTPAPNSYPDTRVAVVTIGENQYTFMSGELTFVEPFLLSTVQAKLRAAYPSSLFTVTAQ